MTTVIILMIMNHGGLTPPVFIQFNSNYSTAATSNYYVNEITHHLVKNLRLNIFIIGNSDYNFFPNEFLIHSCF